MGIVERLRNLAKLIDFKIGSNLANEAADLIERLRGYAQHGKRSDGEDCSAAWVKGAECDCGLTALIKEIKGD